MVIFILVLLYSVVSHLEFITGVSSSICMFRIILTYRLFLTESNSPTGGFAGGILFFFLNLNPHKGRSLKEHLREFDFGGLLLIAAGIVILLLGFNESETSCEHLKLVNVSSCVLPFHLGSSKSTIALLVVGCVTLIAGGVNEVYTKRSPIIPPRVFRVSSTIVRR